MTVSLSLWRLVTRVMRWPCLAIVDNISRAQKPVNSSLLPFTRSSIYRMLAPTPFLDLTSAANNNPLSTSTACKYVDCGFGKWLCKASCHFDLKTSQDFVINFARGGRKDLPSRIRSRMFEDQSQDVEGWPGLQLLDLIPRFVCQWSHVQPKSYRAAIRADQAGHKG